MKMGKAQKSIKNAGGCQHFQGGVNRPAVHLALNCKRGLHMGIDMDGVNMRLFYYKAKDLGVFRRG
jgi:hypothetical protein